jgi:ATP-binding cassette subfamily B protein
MFQPRFLPDFARQKQALLREHAPPQLAMPDAVARTLSSFALAADPVPAGAWQLWAAILRAVKPMIYRAALLSFASSVCSAAATLMAMVILQAQATLQTLWLFALLYFACGFLAQFAIFRSGRLRCWVSLGAESHLVRLISAKLLSLSALAAARQTSGNLKVLVTSDVRHISQFIDSSIRSLLPSLTALLVVAPVIIYLAGLAGVFGLFIMALAIPVSLVLNDINTRFQKRSQAELDSLTTLAGEWVKNVRLIRYLSWDSAFRRDVSLSLRKFMTIAVRQHFLACLIYGLSTGWWMISISGVVLSAWFLNVPLDLVAFFGALWLLTFLSGWFTHLPNIIRLYGLAAASMQRVARLLAEPDQASHLKPAAASLPGRAAPETIIFDDVTFRYASGKVSVDGVSLEVPLDRQLGIIGEIGSGKTTLLRLLCGELPPTEGRILVRFADGEIRDLWTAPTYDLLRSQLAYVPQEPFISSDLFHTNITLSEDSESQDVLTAAYWAELEQDLSVLPRGLSEEIGESGINLSGGQRQRVNLARAFHSRRRTMVLDDTLSAVDTRTEAALMDRLITRGKGFVLVTHRTGELERLEEVVVMRAGRIVEQGDPRILAAQPHSHLTRVLRAYQITESETAHG